METSSVALGLMILGPGNNILNGTSL